MSDGGVGDIAVVFVFFFPSLPPSLSFCLFAVCRAFLVESQWCLLFLGLLCAREKYDFWFKAALYCGVWLGFPRWGGTDR